MNKVRKFTQTAIVAGALAFVPMSTLGISEALAAPLATTMPDGTSNLTLHKKINPADLKANDNTGNVDNAAPGTAAGEGYTFTLKPIATQAQLKNQETYNKLAKITKEQGRDTASRVTAAGFTIGAVSHTAETNAQGVVNFNNVPNGAYLCLLYTSPSPRD